MRLMLLFPVFELFPFSYGRLVGLVLLVAILSPAAVVNRELGLGIQDWTRSG